ncbi:MAG: sigma-70 family RNA polymerase sigma factor [Chitinophagaceae bacterium]
MQQKNSDTLSQSVYTASPEEWVANHADYMYGYAISRLNDDELCRDLVQETFLAALEKLEKFQGKATERTWLTAILKNKIVDVYRKRGSSAGSIVDNNNTDNDDLDFFETLDGHWKDVHRPQEFAKSTEDPLLTKEFNSVLQRCMQKLPSLWFAVFTMKHVEEMTTDLICEEKKVSSANFWVIMHRTKLNLRACLQKNWI